MPGPAKSAQRLAIEALGVGGAHAVRVALKRSAKPLRVRLSVMVNTMHKRGPERYRIRTKHEPDGASCITVERVS
jgi:hypothetical protein